MFTNIMNACQNPKKHDAINQWHKNPVAMQHKLINHNKKTKQEEIKVEETQIELQENKKEDGFIEVEATVPEAWKPEEEGQQIEGVLTKVKERTENSSAMYFLENKEGEHMVWGSMKLDDLMRKVSVGHIVRITFEGKKTHEKDPKKTVKHFKVEHKPIN